MAEVIEIQVDDRQASAASKRQVTQWEKVTDKIGRVEKELRVVNKNLSIIASSPGLGVVGTSADKASVKASLLADRVRRVGRESERTSKKSALSFGKIVAAVTSALVTIRIITGAFRGLVDEIGRVKDASIRLEAIDRSMRVALGSVEEGAEGLRFVREEADRLGLSFGILAPEYAKLSAATKGNSVLQAANNEIFLAAVESSVALGLSMAETSGILKAFRDIASKGTVASEELKRQLGDRLPGAFDIAAKSMGVTTSQLQKLLKSGRITAEQMLPRFAAEMRKAFSPGVISGSKSLQASISRLETAMFDARAEAGKALTPAMKGLSTISIELLGDVKNLVKAWSDLFTVMSEVEEIVTLISVASALAVTQIKRPINELGALAGVLGSIVTSVDEFVSSVVSGAKAPFALFTGDLNDLRKAVNDIKPEIKEVEEDLSNLGDTANDKVVPPLGLIVEKLSKIEAETLRIESTASAMLNYSLAADEAKSVISGLIEIQRESGLSARDAAIEVNRLLGNSGEDSVIGVIKLNDKLEDSRKKLETILLLHQRIEEAIKAQLRIGEIGPVGEIAFTGTLPAIPATQDIGDFLSENKDEIKQILEVEKKVNDQWVTMADNVGTVVSIIGEGVNSIKGLSDGTRDWLKVIFTVIDAWQRLAAIQAQSRAAQAAQGVAGAASSGGGGGALGGLGGIGGALGVIGAVASVFIAIKGAFDAHAERERLRTFNLPIKGGFEAGKGFQGQAIGTGEVSQQEAARGVRAMRDAIDSVRQIVGGMLIDFPQMAIEINNAGDEFRLSIAGSVQGIFESWQEALEVGVAIALRDADFTGLGENLQIALNRIHGGTDTEGLLELIPTIRAVDQLQEGFSDFLVGVRDLQVGLDILSEKMINAGVNFEDIIDFREAELQKMGDLVRQGFESFIPGMSDQVQRYKDLIKSSDEFSQAIAEEAARREALAKIVERKDLGGRGPGPGDGGAPVSPGGVGGGTGGGTTGGSPGGGRDGPAGGGRLRETNKNLEDLGETAVNTSEDLRLVSESLIDLAGRSLELTLEKGFLSGLISTADKFGIKFKGQQEAISKLREIEFNLAIIQLQVQLKAMSLLGLVGDIMLEKFSEWLNEVQSAPLDFGGSVAGGTGQRKASREAIIEIFTELRRQASGMLPGVIDLTVAIEEFSIAQSDARRLGKISAEEMGQAWKDFVTVQRRAVDDLVQTELDAVRGIGEFGRSLIDQGDLFDEARGRLDLLIDVANREGVAIDDLIAQREELTRAENLATTRLGGQGLVASFSELGLSIKPEILERMAQAEFELARIRAINLLLQLQESGVLEELGINFANFFEQITGAEFTFGGAGGIGTLKDIVTDLFAGVRASIQEINSNAEVLTDNAIALGSGQHVLNLIERDRIRSLRELHSVTMDNVSSDVLLASGRGDFQQSMQDLQARLALARKDLLLIRGALVDAGKGTRSLDRDLRRLADAERVGSRAIAVDLIGSLDALGISLPIEQAQALASAQFEVARAQTIAALTTDEFRVALASLGVDAAGLIQLILAGPTSTGSTIGQIRSGSGSSSSISASISDVKSILESFRRAPLGPAAQAAVTLAQSLLDVSINAAKAGVSVSEVNEAFGIAKKTFVDDQLERLAPNVSGPLQDIRDLESTLVDVVASFLIIGASSENIAQAEQSFLESIAAIDAELDRTFQTVLDRIHEIDPRVSKAEFFDESQANFQKTLAAALGGDLDAAQRLASVADLAIDQIISQRAGGVGTGALLDAIAKGLQQAKDADILPLTEFDLLKKQAEDIAKLVTITENQPTESSSSAGFQSISNSFDSIGIDFTTLFDADLLRELIERITASDFSEIITVLGAVPFSEFINSLTKLGIDVPDLIGRLIDSLDVSGFLALATSLDTFEFANLVIDFTPTQLAAFTNAISGADFSNISFDEIVTRLGPLGPIATRIGEENFLEIVNALSPIALAGQETIKTLSGESIQGRLTSVRDSLRAGGIVPAKLTGIDQRIERSSSSNDRLLTMIELRMASVALAILQGNNSSSNNALAMANIALSSSQKLGNIEENTQNTANSGLSSGSSAGG